MPVRSWKFHIGIWLLSFGFIFLFGYLLGHPLAAITVAIAGYACWHAVNALRLHSWQRNSASEIPGSFGLWSDIFAFMQNMKQENLQLKQEYDSAIEEFRNLTSFLPDAMLIVDENDKISWFNVMAGEMLGLIDPDDVGQPVTNLLRGSDFADWLSKKDEATGPLQTASPADDQVWLEVSTVSLSQSENLIIMRDVTKLHNVEQLRRDFVENISHELRTPLTVIKGYLELLVDHSSEDVSRAAGRMQGQASQIQLMLDDLLELSRLQSDETQAGGECVNAPDILIRLREQAEEISAGKHELLFNIDHRLHLSGVASDLESVFRNLIVNAVKYTPDEGKIQVDWQDSPEGPRLIVSDTGIGIPKRDIPRLTERFYRVGSDRARTTGGSGLGLSIVKHALSAHDASLLISSELGQGSKFTCVFPNTRKVSAPPSNAKVS